MLASMIATFSSPSVSGLKLTWTYDASSKRTWAGEDKHGQWVYIGKFAYFGYDELAEGYSGDVDIDIYTKDQGTRLRIFRDSDGGDWIEELDEMVALKEHHFSAPVAASMRYFWYFYLYKDGDAGHMKGDVEVHFEQANGSEFSTEESGLLSVYVGALILYLFTSMFHIAQARELHRMGCYTDTFKLYSTIQGFMLTGSLFQVIHYAQFYRDGVGFVFFYGMGQILLGTTSLLFMTLLLLIAKGWEIVPQKLTGLVEFGAVFSCIIMTHLMNAIWMVAGKDPANSKYFYNTPPGTVIVLEQVGLFVWFSCEAYTTSKKFPQVSFKRRFYVMFGSVYMWFFLVVPFIASIAPHVDDCYRVSWMEGMEVFCNMVWITIFSFFFWPIWVADLYTIPRAQNERSSVAKGTRHQGVDTKYNQQHNLAGGTEHFDNL